MYNLKNVQNLVDSSGKVLTNVETKVAGEVFDLIARYNSVENLGWREQNRIRNFVRGWRRYNLGI